MNPEWCTNCNPREPQVRRPQNRNTTTVHGAGANSHTHASGFGYVLVKIKGAQRTNPFPQIDDKTSFVHIDGYPFYWVLEAILEKGPNVTTIRTIPSFHRKLNKRHLTLCESRGVNIIPGHHAPEHAWEDGSNRSPYYEGQRRFLLSLAGEQKDLFDELLSFGFEAAQMAARYFCLKGEKFMTQEFVGLEFGYNRRAMHTISAMIYAVLHYLDKTFPCNQESEIVSRTMERRVKRIRAFANSEIELQKYAERLGLDKLPRDLPASLFHVFEKIVRAKQDGRLDKLKEHNARAHLVIMKRYGVEDGIFRTLEDTVPMITGVTTRERVRQIQEQAFTFLGIIDEDATSD